MHDSPSALTPTSEQADSLVEEPQATAEGEGAESRPTLCSPPEEETEDFTTPVEELSSHLALERPTTPSSVPLPLSAPSTPVHESAPELPTAPVPGPSDAVNNVEPEKAEPKPAESHAAHPPPPIPPRAVPPVSGAPPPLPRRAAARARPTSVAESPVTPVTGETPAMDDKTEEVANESGASGDEKSSSAKEPKAEDAEQASIPIISEPQDAKENDEREHEHEKLAEDDMESPTVQDHRSESMDHLPPISEDTSEFAESIQFVESSKEGSLRSLEEVPLANDSDEPQEANLEHGTPDDVSEEPSEAAVEDVPGMYVGNSTWEERTWKELVRLREEMFWARIGGLR